MPASPAVGATPLTTTSPKHLIANDLDSRSLCGAGWVEQVCALTNTAAYADSPPTTTRNPPAPPLLLMANSPQSDVAYRQVPSLRRLSAIFVSCRTPAPPPRRYQPNLKGGGPRGLRVLLRLRVCSACAVCCQLVVGCLSGVWVLVVRLAGRFGCTLGVSLVVVGRPAGLSVSGGVLWLLVPSPRPGRSPWSRLGWAARGSCRRLLGPLRLAFPLSAFLVPRPLRGLVRWPRRRGSRGAWRASGLLLCRVACPAGGWWPGRPWRWSGRPRRRWGCVGFPGARRVRVGLRGWWASRRFFWGCAVSPALSPSPAPRVPAPRGAAFVAFARGGLRSVLVRPGASGARLVLVAGFAALPAAGAFARWAARRCGRSVVVRSGPGGAGGAWLVSCPVAWSSSRLPACCGRSVFVAGGVRGLAAALARAGLPRVARGG